MFKRILFTIFFLSFGLTQNIFSLEFDTDDGVLFYNSNGVLETPFQNVNNIFDTILNNYMNKEVLILSPIIQSRKGHYSELFQSLINPAFFIAEIILVTPIPPPNLGKNLNFKNSSSSFSTLSYPKRS